MRRIVSNTGPLIHLDEAQALELLHLAGEIHVPNQVLAEMKYHKPGWERTDWIIVDVLSENYQRQSSAWQQAGLLDAGEAEALALAQQASADWFLTDDAEARLLGKAFGLEVHGSLGIVLWGVAVGILRRSEAEAILDRLARSSLFVSSKILREVRSVLDELFNS